MDTTPRESNHSMPDGYHANPTPQPSAAATQNAKGEWRIGELKSYKPTLREAIDDVIANVLYAEGAMASALMQRVQAQADVVGVAEWFATHEKREGK